MNENLSLLELEAVLRDLDGAPERIAKEKHQSEMTALFHKANYISDRVQCDIRRMFAEAFPNRWYAFLVQRPRDLAGGIDPWPLMLRDAQRAAEYPDRVSPVVEVRL